MSKTLPNFSKVLYLCKIGTILLLTPLGAPRECIQDIISTVEDFCGSPFENTYFTVLNEFHVKNITQFFRNSYFSANWSYIATNSLGGDLDSVSKT